CGICYDEMEPEQTYFLRCGHKFCRSCWISYTIDASNDSSLINILDLRCPQHECGVRLMIDDLQQIEPSLIPKWNNALLQTFIEEDSSYRYCSGPDCGCVAIKLNQSIATTYNLQKVTCDACSTSFCFGCGQNDHVPASCQDIAQWNQIKGSSEFYVKHNSKPCPGCNVPIEKNTGCNHMQCIKCKAGFCWLCLSLLDAHLPHICNRYDSADSADDDFERQALYTVTRYEAHDGAAAFTLNQYTNFEPKKFNETYWFLDQDKDPEIMAQALEILLAGRDFLKHSYVKLLYLKDPKSAKLHEDHHGCLEMFTERLSQLTE
ncbi:hypothetical protein FRACYDRAFT_158501, partial [Fragilariopsis cylindrus CCMP1102]